VRRLGERFVEYLQPMNGRHDRGVLADQAGLGHQRQFQIGIASAFADPHALAVHGHAAADDDVDGLQVAHSDLAREPGCTLAGRGARRRHCHLVRIQKVERLPVGELRHRHIQKLPACQRTHARR
jgi:hypothetical protein